MYQRLHHLSFRFLHMGLFLEATLDQVIVMCLYIVLDMVCLLKKAKSTLQILVASFVARPDLAAVSAPVVKSGDRLPREVHALRTHMAWMKRRPNR